MSFSPEEIYRFRRLRNDQAFEEFRARAIELVKLEGKLPVIKTDLVFIILVFVIILFHVNLMIIL